jgi:methionine synthase II (cobalamin-independent)
LLAGVQRNSYEIRKHGKPGGERCSGSLRTQERRQSVARAARRASRNQIGIGVLQIVGGALERSEIIA